MPAGEDRRQDLLDDRILTDDDLVQLLGHDVAVLAEFVEEFVKVSLFSSQVVSPY